MIATRRSVLQVIPMLAASSAGASDSPTLTSFIKPFSDLPVKQNGQNESRSILNGVTHSGDHLEVHETTLAPGGSPHPPHRHEHEELLLMISGTLAVTIEGKTTVIGPGGAAFFHSNELHGARNPGLKRRSILWLLREFNNQFVIKGDFYECDPALRSAGDFYVGRFFGVGIG